ncbi:MAG: hypothetical protein JWP81_726 [Ferruginibacter sp.]|nr:hypothetical protein [Ferruginibacter sp.]
MNYWKISLLSFVCLFAAVNGRAQTKAPSSETILTTAYAQAVREHKNVMVIFHASWCGWCRKMDSSLNDKACSKFFSDNYVICHLTVDESKGKENLENPGANDFRKKYNGDKAGLPFWLIFNENAQLLADSKMSSDTGGAATAGDNTGCPASDREVDYFIKVIKKTSDLTNEQLSVIAKRFRQNERN